jgi:hypothetical protein
VAMAANDLIIGVGDGEFVAFDAHGQAGCGGTPTTCLPVHHAEFRPMTQYPPIISSGHIVAPDASTLYALAP